MSITLNMIGGGFGENLLAGTTWSDGYVNSSGSIAVPSGRGDLVSDFIDISEMNGTGFLFVSRVHAASPWIGVGFYNSSQAAVSPTRQVTETSYAQADGTYICVGIYNLTNANVQYIRFSFRNDGASNNEVGAFSLGELADSFGEIPVPPV